MWIFINFDNDLYFQDYLLQELDDQTQCEEFGENLMKIDWTVLQIFNVFSVLHGDIFHCQMETKLGGNFHSCNTLFVDLEYLNHNPQTNLQLVEQFARKLTTRVFHFTRKSAKEEKSWDKRSICNVSRTPDWNYVRILRLYIAVCKTRWYIELLIITNSWLWKCTSSKRKTYFRHSSRKDRFHIGDLSEF